MEKETKVVVHEGTGTGIFYKRRYGEGHCNTLPIEYPLSSLHRSYIEFYINGYITCLWFLNTTWYIWQYTKIL